MTHIPMLDLYREYEYMKADIDLAIATCLKHQQWILGPEVKELERQVSNYLSIKHCVGVSSGTEALVLALRALAIQRTGKEYFESHHKIITTPFTFTATGDAILRAGATPLFVDIDPQTFNIDARLIKDCLKKERGVSGILPVHLYGLACDIEEIMQIAHDFGLFVVEDVAQAFGAAVHGKKLGTFGTASAFSFFPSKNLGCFGDGGMVATDDDRLDALIRMPMKHGGKDKYNVAHIGYNARLDTIQAAVLLAKLKRIDEFNQRRLGIAKKYHKKLAHINNIQLPVLRDDGSHVYHQYTIRINNHERDKLRDSLKLQNIESMVYYPVVLNQMKVFNGKSFKYEKLDHAEIACREVLSLPIEPLYDNEVDFICSVLNEVLQ